MARDNDETKASEGTTAGAECAECGRLLSAWLAAPRGGMYCTSRYDIHLTESPPWPMIDAYYAHRATHEHRCIREAV